MSKNRRINSFETIWALGGQSKILLLSCRRCATWSRQRRWLGSARVIWRRSWRDVALAFWQSSARDDEETRAKIRKRKLHRTKAYEWLVAVSQMAAGEGQGEDEDECRKNWMKREKDTERATRGRKIVLLHKKCRRTSWSQCNISCKRWRKGGTISCLSTKRCKRWHKRYKESKTREKITERKLGGKRRNAKNQRRN